MLRVFILRAVVLTVVAPHSPWGKTENKVEKRVSETVCVLVETDQV
jgi:hypothetical protein